MYNPDYSANVFAKNTKVFNKMDDARPFMDALLQENPKEIVWWRSRHPNIYVDVGFDYEKLKNFYSKNEQRKLTCEFCNQSKVESGFVICPFCGKIECSDCMHNRLFSGQIPIIQDEESTKNFSETSKTEWEVEIPSAGTKLSLSNLLAQPGTCQKCGTMMSYASLPMRTRFLIETSVRVCRETMACGPNGVGLADYTMIAAEVIYNYRNLHNIRHKLFTDEILQAGYGGGSSTDGRNLKQLYSDWGQNFRKFYGIIRAMIHGAHWLKTYYRIIDDNRTCPHYSFSPGFKKNWIFTLNVVMPTLDFYAGLISNLMNRTLSFRKVKEQLDEHYEHVYHMHVLPGTSRHAFIDLHQNFVELRTPKKFLGMIPTLEKCFDLEKLHYDIAGMMYNHPFHPSCGHYQFNTFQEMEKILPNKNMVEKRNKQCSL